MYHCLHCGWQGFLIDGEDFCPDCDCNNQMIFAGDYETDIEKEEEVD